MLVLVGLKGVLPGGQGGYNGELIMQTLGNIGDTNHPPPPSRSSESFLNSPDSAFSAETMTVDGIFDCFYFHFDSILFSPLHVNLLTVKWQTEASENQTPHYNVSGLGARMARIAFRLWMLILRVRLYCKGRKNAPLRHFPLNGYSFGRIFARFSDSDYRHFICFGVTEAPGA